MRTASWQRCLAASISSVGTHSRLRGTRRTRYSSPTEDSPTFAWGKLVGMESAISIQRAQWEPALRLFLDRAFEWFVYAYIFITIFLPGGTLYGVNFKYPLYLGLLPLAVYSAFFRRQATAGQVALIIGVPALLSSWVVISFMHGFELPSAVRQYTDILLTLLLCWLGALFSAGGEAHRFRFLKLVLAAEIATSALKIGLIAYAVIRGIPVVEMVASLSSIFGVELMTMDLGALFGRVQFVSDELIPVSIFIVLRHRDRLGIGSFRASVTILLLFLSVLFSFSRYFWAFTALAFVVGLALGKRDRFQAILITVLGVTVLASLPALGALYELRFSETVAGGSDLFRTEQIHALKDFFVDAPLLGHGLGSYSTQDLRDTSEAGRYSYEVQLLALAGQIGIIGMAFLLAIGVYYYQRLWWKSPLSPSDRIGVGLLLGFWVAAGTSNPLLFHPIAGVNYATLAILAAISSKEVPRLRAA